ncbi:MAG TPA: tetratricopeptide repeat protein [Methanosarcina sp.]|jgi:tetratricopeptide (TPR) repeat protein|nr:tetratricopeptide repeat protein [Methanosarcina sp.]
MDVEELIKKADELRRMGKYEEALPVYERVLEECPNNVPALIGKVVVLRGLKRYNEALIVVDKAIEVGSESTEELAKAWSNRGFVLRDLKKYGESLEAFKISISFNPESAFLWNAKGLVLLNLQKYNEAVEAYTTSLDKNSFKNEHVIDEKVRKEIVFSFNGKGVAFANLGQFDNSIEAFNESIKLDPKSAFALSGKATVYHSIGKLEEALNFFEASLNFDSTSSFAWNGKGLALLSLNQFDTAIDSFKKSIFYDGDFISAHNNLAGLYLDIGDLKNASSILNDSFFKDPNNYFTLFLKGRIKLEKQQYDSAIDYFKEAISLSTGSPLILIWEVYAKYLEAEVSFDSNDKMYQDLIISCIRDLEKINTPIKDLKKTNKYISLNNTTECLNLKICEKIRKKLLMSTQSFLVKRKYNSNISTKLLAKVTSELLRYNTLRIESYNSYFLGCFFYKLKDYFSAKDEFANCIKLNFGPKVTNSAEQLLEDIWNHKINTSIPKWWLKSPYHSFRRKITFLFLLLSIFGLLLPESSFLFLLILYNYTTKILMLFQPIYELLNSILLIIFSLFFTALSFIDWKDNTTQCAFLFVFLFFFLVSPCLKSLKGSEIEIELQSPQNFELTPGLIERNLKDLEKGLKK